MIIRLLFTLSLCFGFLIIKNLDAEVTATNAVSSVDKQDLEAYETNDFDSPIIKTSTISKPTCRGNECINKILLGIGLHYNNEKNFVRATSGHPKEITISKLFFPYYEHRKNLDTSSLESEEVTSLSKKIKAELSNKKTAVVLLDAHGIKKASPYQDGGILIPEQSGCEEYQKSLQKISIEIKNLPPNSPQYQELLTKYQQTYQQYSQKLCHQRILPYQEYETSLNGPTLIHFNSIDPVHQMNRQKIGEQYALFDSFSFLGSAIYQHNYYLANHKEYTQTYVYSAASNYKNELEKYNLCTFDIDKNNQIQLNEIYNKLNPIFFTEGLKKGSSQEKTFNWNTMGTRQQINNKRDLTELFSSNPGKYSEAYSSTFNSPGFSVVFNLSGCKIANAELFDSTKKLLADSPSLKQKTPKLLPTYDVNNKDAVTFDNLLISADDPKNVLKKTGVSPEAQASPIAGADSVKQLTADKAFVKDDNPKSKASATSPIKITADKKKQLFITSTSDKNPYQNAAQAIMEIEGTVSGTSRGKKVYYVHRDPNGRNYSIGYGHNLTPEEINLYETKYPNGVPEEIVQKILADDVGVFYNNVTDVVNSNIQLNENQKTALTSLAYSIGNGAFNTSGLLELINSNASMEEIQNRWYAYNKLTNKYGEKVFSRGLANRRIKEWQLFTTPI